MISDNPEMAFYWSLPTGAIINLDLPGATKAIAALGAYYPCANQAACDKIDELVKQLVSKEKEALSQKMAVIDPESVISAAEGTL